MPKLTFYRTQWFGNGYVSFDPGYGIELHGQFKKTLMANAQVEMEVPAGNSQITISYRALAETINIHACENDFYYIKISPYKYFHRVAILSPVAFIVSVIGKSFWAYVPLLTIAAYMLYTIISNRIYIQVFKNEVPDF